MPAGTSFLRARRVPRVAGEIVVRRATAHSEKTGQTQQPQPAVVEAVAIVDARGCRVGCRAVWVSSRLSQRRQRCQTCKQNSCSCELFHSGSNSSLSLACKFPATLVAVQLVAVTDWRSAAYGKWVPLLSSELSPCRSLTRKKTDPTLSKQMGGFSVPAGQNSDIADANFRARRCRCRNIVGRHL